MKRGKVIHRKDAKSGFQGINHRGTVSTATLREATSSSGGLKAEIRRKEARNPVAGAKRIGTPRPRPFDKTSKGAQRRDAEGAEDSGARGEVHRKEAKSPRRLFESAKIPVGEVRRIGPAGPRPFDKTSKGIHRGDAEGAEDSVRRVKPRVGADLAVRGRVADGAPGRRRERTRAEAVLVDERPVGRGGTRARPLKRERSRKSAPVEVERPVTRKAVVAERRALKAGPPPGPVVRRTLRRAAPVVRMAPAAYYALVVPGIEDLAAAELRAAGATIDGMLARFDKRDSIVLFSGIEPARALRCGLLDDVFQVVADAPTPEGMKGAKLLAAGLDRAQFERAMTAHHALQPKSARRSFKVVARVAGKHAFHREDVERAHVAAIGEMLPRWSPAGDKGAIEVWVHVVGARTITGLRLSGDDLAQRRYKHAHLPASLTPTVARALVTLVDPQPNDVMLDAMCGAGTILRERAEAGRAALIVGGDIVAEAVDAARINAGKQAALARWDATRLPLKDGSVNSVVMNPPYGRQHQAVAGLERLYGRSMRELARVLRPGGRAVVLTGEPLALGRAVPPAMRVVSQRRMLLRGLAVVAFVIERR